MLTVTLKRRITTFLPFCSIHSFSVGGGVKVRLAEKCISAASLHYYLVNCHRNLAYTASLIRLILSSQGLIILGDEEMKPAIGVAALLVWLVSTGPAQAETIRCYIKQFDIWGAPPHQQIYDANITVSAPKDAKKGKIRWLNDDRTPGAVLGHARQGTLIIEEIFHGSSWQAVPPCEPIVLQYRFCVVLLSLFSRPQSRPAQLPETCVLPFVPSGQ